MPTLLWAILKIQTHIVVNSMPCTDLNYMLLSI
jgi:hypothetical protein